MGSESELAFLYAYMHAYVLKLVTLSASGGKPRVQNGDSGSYMDAIFEPLVQKEAGIWTSLLFNQVRLQLPG